MPAMNGSDETAKRTGGARGVSLIETVIVLAVALVLTVMTAPSIIEVVKTYRLSTTATPVSSLLQRARYEAVRRNTNTCFRVAQQGGIWAFCIDIDNHGTITTGE